MHSFLDLIVVQNRSHFEIASLVWGADPPLCHKMPPLWKFTKNHKKIPQTFWKLQHAPRGPFYQWYDAPRVNNFFSIFLNFLNLAFFGKTFKAVYLRLQSSDLDSVCCIWLVLTRPSKWLWFFTLNFTLKVCFSPKNVFFCPKVGVLKHIPVLNGILSGIMFNWMIILLFLMLY